MVLGSMCADPALGFGSSARLLRFSTSMLCPVDLQKEYRSASDLVVIEVSINEELLR